MGGWCGVCDGAAKGRRAKAAERATVPSGLLARSLLVLTSHLTDSSSQPATSGKQAPHRRSANLLRYAKSPGKTPAVPWYYGNAHMQTTTDTTLL